jgi:phenylalanyl-tRNA synthetase alpha chain
MKEKLENILKEAQQLSHHIKNSEDLENFRVKFLGRQGLLSEIIKHIEDLPQEQRREFGIYFNFVKSEIQKIYDEKKEIILKPKTEYFDPYHPGEKIDAGRINLITKEFKIIREIFSKLNFNIEIGNEIVNEYENFDSLNIPPNHPSRDLWDTFWITKDLKNKNLLLRTHTSAHQVELLKKYKIPCRFVVLGKVFRHEATDQRHEIQFHQIEGVSVGQNSNISELKSVLSYFFENYFNKKLDILFRSSYFPFTEPSFEIDIECIFCNKKGCNVCKFSKFIEVAGAGMIHPFVLKQAGIDYEKNFGYAFGLGFERLVMLKYNINDIRYFHSGDLRFINQF